MENKNEKQAFEFTYSAKQQDEIKYIRDKYIKKEEDKMETLRRLDKSVTKKGTMASLIVGIIGSLIMGTGMSCTMVWTDKLLLPGIIIGIVGIVLVSLAYPLYSKIIKKEREKIAPEILRLTEELMK